MNEENLIKYYNKFNEDKRLNTKHGNIEFKTALYYIDKYIKPNNKILDIGAGTGKYSIYYSDKGYDVTAVELVKHNLKVIEKNNKDINCVLGNAIDLSMIPDNTYDITVKHSDGTYEDLKVTPEIKTENTIKGKIIICVISLMRYYNFIKDAVHCDDLSIFRNIWLVINVHKPQRIHITQRIVHAVSITIVRLRIAR